jgi:hypothetical protein
MCYNIMIFEHQKLFRLFLKKTKKTLKNSLLIQKIMNLNQENIFQVHKLFYFVTILVVGY